MTKRLLLNLLVVVGTRNRFSRLCRTCTTTISSILPANTSVRTLNAFYDLDWGADPTFILQEQFANGVTAMSLYIRPSSHGVRRTPVVDAIRQLVKETSLLYCLPQTPFQSLFQTAKLSGTDLVAGLV